MLPVLSTLLAMNAEEVKKCKDGIEKVKAFEDGTAAYSDAYKAVGGEYLGSAVGAYTRPLLSPR